MKELYPLHKAVQNKNLGKIKTLLKSGNDINMKSSYGQKTALHYVLMVVLNCTKNGR